MTKKSQEEMNTCVFRAAFELRAEHTFWRQLLHNKTEIL